jgi:hypothetical protein
MAGRTNKTNVIRKRIKIWWELILYFLCPAKITGKCGNVEM